MTSTSLMQLEDLARNVLFPVISAATVLYSNDKGHPFEVQYVAGWITTSVFHESNQRLLKFLLSSGLCLNYVEEFTKAVQKLSRTYTVRSLDGTLVIRNNLTWMQSMNICGSFYLAITWLFMMALQYKPEIMRYRKQASAAAGISYMVVTLALYRKFKRN